jgi:hypothetical protein
VCDDEEEEGLHGVHRRLRRTEHPKLKIMLPEVSGQQARAITASRKKVGSTGVLDLQGGAGG